MTLVKPHQLFTTMLSTVKLPQLALIVALILLPSLRCYAQDDATADDDFFEEDVDVEAELYDPWEGFNRGVFWFNEQFDSYLLKPVAQGYDYIVPKGAQRSVRNFFKNLGYPSNLVSSLIRLDFSEAGTHTARFAINTTAGIGGLFDVADDCGLKAEQSDFGIALGHYDVPAGPYLVLPFLGPSNVRDGLSAVVDGFLDPVYYVGAYSEPESTQWAIDIGTKALQIVNRRAQLLEASDSAKKASLDYYLFMQSAHYQMRVKEIRRTQHKDRAESDNDGTKEKE